MRIAAALLLALATSAAFAQLSEGEVRKIDRNAGKITVKHGEIKSVDMPPMTMVFEVRDRKPIEQIKLGEAVRFDVEKQGGAYVLTRLEGAK